jgi:cytochrome P450
VQTIGGRRWPYAYLEHCQATCGDTFTLYPLGRTPLVFLADPQDIRTVLTGDATELHPGAGGSVIAPLIGEHSFMLLEGDDHLWSRKIITPAFHKQIVEDQTAALTDVVERSVASWPNGLTIPLNVQIRALTLTVILRIIFSGERQEQLTALQHRLTRMLTVSDSLLLQGPRLRAIPGWRGKWRQFLDARAQVDKLLYSIVGRRRASCETGERGDLLDLLLSAQGRDGVPISEREIRDNLMSMILAGHETTTGELSWAFQLLAHHPEVQATLAEQLSAASDDRYLTATVHETLRRRPVFVFTIPRVVAATVRIGKWTYPPSVQLAACTYLMHHNPDLYPDPYAFRPERFLGTAAQPRTWLPWGGGRKHCLGRHFAMLEVQAVLRAVLSNRAVLPVSSAIERPRWRSAILVPGAGGRVRLRARGA